MPLILVRYDPALYTESDLDAVDAAIRSVVARELSSHDVGGELGDDDMEIYCDPMRREKERDYDLVINIECRALPGRRANHRSRADRIRLALEQSEDGGRDGRVAVWLKLVEAEWSETDLDRRPTVVLES